MAMTQARTGARTPWWHEYGALCLAAVLALPLFTPRVYASDEVKYFVTLRSLYFDHDLHYANDYSYFVSRDPVAHAGLRPYAEEVTPTGYRLNDAPIGSAVLWLPFYVAADVGVLVARAVGADVARDGFSRPYTRAVCVGSLVWGTVGLVLIYRLCRRYVARTPATWAVLAIWFASPVVFYLYITPAMAHANSLFSVALFLTIWHRGRGARSTGGWALLGAAAGLMVLVRELNWLFLLVIAVDETRAIVTNALAAMSKGMPRSVVAIATNLGVEVGRRLTGYAAFAVALAVVVAPQFYVYKTLNGTFAATPFVVQKFSRVPRYAIDVLFSGFHGLFSWHPVTLAGVIGLAALWRRDPLVAGALSLVFVIQVLLIGSYATWWGGASFGARRFINCTAIFALGLAAALDRMRPRTLRLAGAGLVFLVLWNAGLAVQYSVGLIPRDTPVTMSRIVRNQLFEVPPRAVSIAWRFAFDRSSFYRTRQ